MEVTITEVKYNNGSTKVNIVTNDLTDYFPFDDTYYGYFANNYDGTGPGSPGPIFAVITTDWL